MISKIFFVLYLLIGFVPYFGASDKQATQIIYLQLINILSLIYIGYISFKRKERKTFLLNSISFQAFFLFFIWSALSLLAAINKIESLRILTEVYTYVLSFYCLYYHLKKIKKPFFIKTVTLLCSVEILTIIIPFYTDIFMFGGFNLRSSSYSGITGNINIAAFSLLMKLPFVLYYLIRDKNKTYTNIIYTVILVAGIYSIFNVLVTRGAILGVFIYMVIIFAYLFREYIFIQKVPVLFLKKISRILILPLIGYFFLNTVQNNLSNNNNSVSIIDRMSTVGSQKDGSSQERIRYWTQAASTIVKNPLLGIGIGNWKLKGIETEKENINNFIVPYHAHNDFLEISVETGIIGGVLYFSFILIPFLILIFLLYKKRGLKKTLLPFILFLAISGFLMDSMLNFPFARPIQMIFIISIVVFCIHNYGNLKLNNKKVVFSKLFYVQILILILLAPISLYSSIRLYKSSVEQFLLLGQFNTNTFTIPLSDLEQFEMEYPNLSNTTIPLKTFKGIYYLKQEGMEDQAIEMFQKGNKENPYLKISESYMGYAFARKGMKDSAKYFSKRAFEKHPNNASHYAHYVIALSMFNDTLAITKTYEKAKKYMNDETIDRIYYMAMANLLDKDEGREIVDKLNRSLLETKNDRMKEDIYVLEFGRKQTMQADYFYKEGLDLFDQKKFEEAAIKFEDASKLNPLELPYFENAANAYLQISNHKKALEMADYVIENSISPNGKAHYIKGLVYLEKGDKISGCKMLRKSAGYGFNGAKTLANAACR